MCVYAHKSKNILCVRTHCIEKFLPLPCQKEQLHIKKSASEHVSLKEMATVLSIDIGGTSTKLAAVDEAFNVLDTVSVSTQDFKNEDAFFAGLFQAIEEISGRLTKEHKFQGIGIGAPCGIPEEGVIYGAVNLPFPERVEIVKLVEERFLLPTLLTKDSYAATLGVQVQRGAEAMANYVVLTLGTGLGCGIVVNHQLVTGANGQAGEWGHTAIARSNRTCHCGKVGCLETYVSATGIKRTLFQLLADSNESSVFRDLTFNQVTAEEIYQAALMADPLALEAFSITGEVLGAKLAELVAIFEPEAIFLAGGLANAGEILIEKVAVAMEEQLLSIYKGKVKVLRSSSATNEAAIIGAASIVWNHLKSSSKCLS